MALLCEHTDSSLPDESWQYPDALHSAACHRGALDHISLECAADHVRPDTHKQSAAACSAELQSPATRCRRGSVVQVLTIAQLSSVQCIHDAILGAQRCRDVKQSQTHQSSEQYLQPESTAECRRQASRHISYRHIRTIKRRRVDTVCIMWSSGQHTHTHTYVSIYRNKLTLFG